MILTSNINIIWQTEQTSVLKRACSRFLRDISMTLAPPDAASSDAAPAELVIATDRTLPPEAYTISVSTLSATQRRIRVTGADELGIIYALLFISEKFLGVTPFWYWNDQAFTRKPFIEIPDGSFSSPSFPFRYRGWFINDEVLLDAWGQDHYDPGTGITENEAFEMVMEALLRLGGNMVIPGTDHNSHKFRRLAADMGFWITHHHAEPLGAKMFAREYPDLTPSYSLYPELFEKLWRDAIEEQKGNNVIWNIGFRGQGDRPFWSDDPSYDTPGKRGALISSLITRQYEILCEYMDNPICCTNLYGEVMELYRQGHISLPEQVICIWADNGYGKMVSRRQGRHNPRIEALPPSPVGKHGIYYHASFYDLQAASHITMLPNSTQFVEKELRHAVSRGVHEFLVINCSNVRPHTYMLDHIARIWGKQAPSYTSLYFPRHAEEAEELYRQYFRSMLSYGPSEDEHAGEQYYHYTMRAVCHGWLAGNFDRPEEDLLWLSPEKDLNAQVAAIRELGTRGLAQMQDYYLSCTACVERLRRTDGPDSKELQLFQDSVLLQAVIHYKSLLAQLNVCKAYETFRQGRFEASFVQIGQAIEYLQEALSAMEAADHGKWQGFYDNDCLTDIKFTAYTLEKIMGYIRNEGDGPHFYRWFGQYMSNDAGKKVVLITNMRNHPKDWELYLAMKQKERC